MERQPRFVDAGSEIVGAVIKKSSYSVLIDRYPEDDYLCKLPRIEVSDDVEICEIKHSDEFQEELRKRGLSSRQIAAVNNTLWIVYDLTVGEFRGMSDGEILEIRDLRGNIGLKRLVTLRLLFGSIEEDSLVSNTSIC